MIEDNTNPDFFALWSIRQLQVECARLNQVLKECIEVLEHATEVTTLKNKQLRRQNND